MRYDGAPIEVAAPGTDEDWIPAPGEVALAGTSLGAFPSAVSPVHHRAEAGV
ncbi:MAG: hypothetical protein R3B54_01655 [Bdellovibrionota bacterium]